jgi:hypothetical protein
VSLSNAQPPESARDLGETETAAELTHLREDNAALVGRISELEDVLRGLIQATDELHHLEGPPHAIRDLSRFRIRARQTLLDRDD